MANPILEFYFGGWETIDAECHYCWSIVKDIKHKVSEDRINFTCTVCDKVNSYE